MKKTFNVAEEINDIKAFRKDHKGKCVSTSHWMTMNGFMMISAELKKRFKTFTVEFREVGPNVKKDKEVEVRIPMFGRRI